jgi:hypothetical protein
MVFTSVGNLRHRMILGFIENTDKQIQFFHKKTTKKSQRTQIHIFFLIFIEFVF